MPNVNKTAVQNYFNRRESRWGYQFLLKGTKHYGYYPKGLRAGLTLIQSQRLMEEELGKTLGLPKGSRVLDAGCGEGKVAIHLTQAYGYKITGIDILEQSIKSAKENTKKLGMAEPDFQLMDYSALDFPDNSFDGAYTLETLVHAGDYKQVLKELYRVLKPGGVLVNLEYSLDDNIPPENEKVWEVIYRGGAMWHTFKDFRKSNMKIIWENAGFVKVSVFEATQEMEPFMKRLYQIAYIPFHILKLFGKEKNYVNTFTGVRSYQLREEFQYNIIKSSKPK